MTKLVTYKVFVISNIDNIISVKYTFTLNYNFNDIYEAAYDLVRESCIHGKQIVLLSHDSIKQLMYFKLL